MQLCRFAREYLHLWKQLKHIVEFSTFSTMAYLTSRLLLPHHRRHLSTATILTCCGGAAAIGVSSMTTTTTTTKKSNFHTTTVVRRPGYKPERNPKIGITLEQLRMAARGQGRRLPICHEQQERVMNSLEAAKYEVSRR